MTDHWDEWEMEAFAKGIAAVLRESDPKPDPSFPERVKAAVRQYGPYVPYPTPHLREHPHEHVPNEHVPTPRREPRVQSKERPVRDGWHDRRPVWAHHIWSVLPRQTVTSGGFMFVAAMTSLIIVMREGMLGRTDDHRVAQQHRTRQQVAQQPMVLPHVIQRPVVTQPPAQAPAPPSMVASTHPLMPPQHPRHVQPSVPHEIPPHDVAAAPVQREVPWGEVEATPAPPPEPVSPLEGRVSPAVRQVVEQITDSLRVVGIPDVLVVGTALDEAAKGADDARILVAVRRVAHELLTVRRAWPVLPHHDLEKP